MSSHSLALLLRNLAGIHLASLYLPAADPYCVPLSSCRRTYTNVTQESQPSDNDEPKVSGTHRHNRHKEVHLTSTAAIPSAYCVCYVAAPERGGKRKQACATCKPTAASCSCSATRALPGAPGAIQPQCCPASRGLRNAASDRMRLQAQQCSFEIKQNQNAVRTAFWCGHDCSHPHLGSINKMRLYLSATKAAFAARRP